MIKAIILDDENGLETVWYPEISESDPLVQALFSKYETDGCAVTGDKKDILLDLKENL